MKKRIFLSVVLILIMVVNFAYATENPDVMLVDEAIPEEWQRTGENAEEEIEEILSESQFLAEENLTLQNTAIDGNLFALGTTVSLNNVVVYGDIYICGQDVTISNITVYGTAFLAGENVNMNNANFAGNVFNASLTMNFTGIAQDIFAVAENIEFNEESLVYRDVFAIATKAVFKGGIGRNANISSEEIIVMSNANINGTLTYSSEQEANIDSESRVGAVNFNKQEIIEEEEENLTLNDIIYNYVAIMVKSIFVCGFIFLFARGFMEKQKTENMVNFFGINILKGFGWLILIPVIGLLVLCSGVAVGLSFTIFALYSIVLWASVPVVAIAITANITKNKEYNTWKLYGYSLVVSLVLTLLKQISVIGGWVTFIVAIAAMGIIFSSLKNKTSKTENVETEIIQ